MDQDFAAEDPKGIAASAIPPVPTAVQAANVAESAPLPEAGMVQQWIGVPFYAWESAIARKCQHHSLCQL